MGPDDISQRRKIHFNNFSKKKMKVCISKLICYGASWASLVAQMVKNLPTI